MSDEAKQVSDITEMYETTAKSFRAKEGMIHIYADEEGTDLVVSIPIWMFEQMANKLLRINLATIG